MWQPLASSFRLFALTESARIARTYDDGCGRSHTHVTDSDFPLLSLTTVCRLVLTAVSPLCVMHVCVVDSVLPLAFDSSLPLYDMHVCVFDSSLPRTLDSWLQLVFHSGLPLCSVKLVCSLSCICKCIGSANTAFRSVSAVGELHLDHVHQRSGVAHGRAIVRRVLVVHWGDQGSQV